MTCRAPGERALHVHEVGARLRERGAAVAQHRRRVERGDEHRAVAERELLAAQLRDALLGVEEQLGGEVAERDDDRGSMNSSCASRYGRHASISSGLRVAVARRPALHDVRDVHLVAVEPDALDQAGEQPAGAADERLAVEVFLLARALAHEHQVGVAGRRRRTPPGCASPRAGSCSTSAAPRPSATSAACPVPRVRGPRPGDDGDPVFAALREWRAGIARDEGMPAYVIADDADPRRHRRGPPRVAQRLRRAKGMGPAKLEKYGDGILEPRLGRLTVSRSAPGPGTYTTRRGPRGGR